MRGSTFLLSISLLLAVTLSSMGCASPQLAERRHNRAAFGAYLRGLMLERSAKLPDALQAYRLALERDRHSAQLNVRIGATQLKLGESEKAL